MLAWTKQNTMHRAKGSFMQNICVHFVSKYMDKSVTLICCNSDNIIGTGIN